MDEPAQTEPGGQRDPPGAEQDLLDTSAAGPAAIRGSLIRAAGYLGSAVVSLLSVSLLIRHIGVVDFGHYVTVLSLIALAATLSDAGLSTVGIREYAVRPPAERDRLMANLLGLRCVLTVVAALGAAAFALVAGYESRLVIGTLIAGLGMVLTVLQGTYAVPLTAMLRLGTVTALDFARQLLLTGAIVAVVLAGGTLLTFLALPIPGGLLILLATLWFVHGEIPVRPQLDRRECIELLRTVLPFAISVAVGALYFRVTIIVMSLIASEEQTGYYATAYRILEVVVLLPGLVVGATFPVLARAARDDSERLRYIITRLSEAMIIVGGWVAVSTVLGAPFAVEVLAGGSSDPTIPVLQIQGIAIGVIFIATAWGFGLLSLARYRTILIASSIGLIIVLSLSLVLIPELGARGAALSLVAGDSAQAFIGFQLLRRGTTAIRFPVRTVLCVLIACGLGLATLLVPWLSSLTRTLVASVIYFAAVAVLGAIPVEMRQALRERWAR